MELGSIGVWTWAFDEQPWHTAREAVAEIEDLGYGTVWFGEGRGRDSTTQAALMLSATRRIVVAPGVANIYRHEPGTLAQSERTLNEAFPGRFLLGLGVGAETLATSVGKTWRPPIEAMRDFLDRMDTATLTAPAAPAPPRRVLAALGPKMLALSAERTWGAHPFLLPLEHTAHARKIVGPDALLAVHQAVALHKDPATARGIARQMIAQWIAHVQVVPSRWNVVRDLLGFDDSDLADGGSDRLVAAMVAHGDLDTVAERVRAQLAAGADHVCVGVATEDPKPALALAELRELASALL
ncbi:TIGR03620 family F420-dependent LLM class oxidoreductase [Spongiactinospora sp. TRM90649]|uniref:TIGR03620 family F420-dependent LLM class oxidoreductase n=1 Tax=Spongiactinospora sp. TRM90649 TaxID=3031114 RepID=UPI0023F88648|nr:TIGR03620 family F420-dependent LLM class oxidoreductase [Spongiactinospora sp. TRM90649]MDF5756979.1 TIGR03620 family F420-dependent LLM class oxidoreductase [Spongiactinospora sp. TRM90649]